MNHSKTLNAVDAFLCHDRGRYCDNDLMVDDLREGISAMMYRLLLRLPSVRTYLYIYIPDLYSRYAQKNSNNS